MQKGKLPEKDMQSEPFTPITKHGVYTNNMEQGNTRLEQQMRFIFELEKLKVVYRQNGTHGGERRENSAEHSWHVALMALILREYCKEKIDTEKTLAMLLIHDTVEIYAGDVFLYDESARENIKPAEKEAARKIFGLLPDDQKKYFTELWEEFEKAQTPEAQYARVLDNLQPVLNHCAVNNQNIVTKSLTKAQIIKKKAFIKDFSEELWEFMLRVIDKSVAIGLYKK